MSRAGWTTLVLFLHILGVIAAVGPTLTYGMWVARADKVGPEHRSFVLQTVSWVDGHLATPAFVVQAFTGVALFLLQGRDLIQTAWLLCGVGLYVVAVAYAMGVLAPATKRTVAAAVALDAAPGDPAARRAYDAAAATNRLHGMAIGLITLGILFFMIVKPTLWSAG